MRTVFPVIRAGCALHKCHGRDISSQGKAKQEILYSHRVGLENGRRATSMCGELKLRTLIGTILKGE